jgi:hypothetical protein
MFALLIQMWTMLHMIFRDQSATDVFDLALLAVLLVLLNRGDSVLDAIESRIIAHLLNE